MPAPAAPAVTVADDGGAGSSVRLPLGSDLEVELASNRTTGYTWHLANAHPARLSLKSHRYRPRAVAGAPVRLGAGGTEIFVFVPIAAGDETLRFEYRRGAAGEPGRIYRLAVTIVRSPAAPAEDKP